MAETIVTHTEPYLNLSESMGFEDNFFESIDVSELLENPPDWHSKHWHFRVFLARNIPYLYRHLSEERITPALQKAYDEGLDLIEICIGHFDHPIWVPVTNDLNVSALKKAWALFRLHLFAGGAV